MKSDWQDKVIASFPHNNYFDPRTHNLATAYNYTRWDLEKISMSDLIFACFEKDNPSGFGMCAEIGFATALKIPTLLVDEKKMDSWKFIKECCFYSCCDLEEGILFYKEYCSRLNKYHNTDTCKYYDDFCGF